MNWYSQLTHLILSFYREDLEQLDRLQTLERCKISRRWGVLKIDCPNHLLAEALLTVSDVLREPIAQLRLAHRVNICVRGTLITALPVDGSAVNSWRF